MTLGLEKTKLYKNLWKIVGYITSNKKGTNMNRPYGLDELLDMNFCFTRVNKLVFDSSISLWQSIDCEMMI